MPEPILIRRADTEEVIDLRWRILRAGLGRETAYFEGDREETTRHMVAERAGRIVGCVTLLRRPRKDRPAWQMRGMAVEPEVQRAGIGRLLLAEVERIVRTEPHSRQLWCNARTPARRFYEKLGWSAEGDVFDIPTAGPHIRMTKRLDE